MRPMLALAILLVGLKGAVPETLYQQSLPAGPQQTISSHGIDTANGGADHALGLALPSDSSASSDAPHDQGEQAAEPPRSPAPASTDMNAAAGAVGSIYNLCNALFVSAENNDLPVPFFANLIWQESRLQLDAVSRVGALGIAQFMPKVAVEVGLGDPFDPHQAIPASARFLHTLREHFGNLGFVAAAYNAGAHRVADWLEHGRSLPRETRDYVVRVTGRSAEAWRRSPVDDSRLTFVRPMPCRQLPAFAELEQAQLLVSQRPDDAEQTDAGATGRDRGEGCRPGRRKDRQQDRGKKRPQRKEESADPAPPRRRAESGSQSGAVRNCRQNRARRARQPSRGRTPAAHDAREAQNGMTSASWQA